MANRQESRGPSVETLQFPFHTFPRKGDHGPPDACAPVPVAPRYSFDEWRCCHSPSIPLSRQTARNFPSGLFGASPSARMHCAPEVIVTALGMNQTFERLYRQLAYATSGTLLLALVLGERRQQPEERELVSQPAHSSIVFAPGRRTRTRAPTGKTPAVKQTARAIHRSPSSLPGLLQLNRPTTRLKARTL